jgi:hypothetical protein
MRGVGGAWTAEMRPKSAKNAAPKEQLFAEQHLLANNRRLWCLQGGFSASLPEETAIHSGG